MKATDPTKAKGEATRRSPANVLRSTLFPDSSRMSWLDAQGDFSVCVYDDFVNFKPISGPCSDSMSCTAHYRLHVVMKDDSMKEMSCTSHRLHRLVCIY